MLSCMSTMAHSEAANVTTTPHLPLVPSLPPLWLAPCIILELDVGRLDALSRALPLQSLRPTLYGCLNALLCHLCTRLDRCGIINIQV